MQLHEGGKVADTVRSLMEGKNARGVRDGSGPYKGSAEASMGGKGKRKRRGEKCPVTEAGKGTLVKKLTADFEDAGYGVGYGMKGGRVVRLILTGNSNKVKAQKIAGDYELKKGPRAGELTVLLGEGIVAEAVMMATSALQDAYEYLDKKGLPVFIERKKLTVDLPIKELRKVAVKFGLRIKRDPDGTYVLSEGVEEEKGLLGMLGEATVDHVENEHNLPGKPPKELYAAARQMNLGKHYMTWIRTAKLDSKVSQNLRRHVKDSKTLRQKAIWTLMVGDESEDGGPLDSAGGGSGYFIASIEDGVWLAGTTDMSGGLYKAPDASKMVFADGKKAIAAIAKPLSAKAKKYEEETKDDDKWGDDDYKKALDQYLARKSEMFKKGNVKIVVKKEDGEWVAAYYVNNKRDEGKTYYSGGDAADYKQDAIATAKDMLKSA